MEPTANVNKPTNQPLFAENDCVTIDLTPYSMARATVLAGKHAQFAPKVPPSGVLRVISITVGQDTSGASLYLYRLAESPEADRRSFVTIPEQHLIKAVTQ